MNVILKITRTILQSEFERYLPDGAGHSLPVPTRFRASNSIGVFVFSTHQGLAAPPQGIFYLSTDLSRVLAYTPYAACGEPVTLPALPTQESAALLAEIDRLLPAAAAAFFGSDPSAEAGMQGAAYLAAVKRLAGESIRFYQELFPDFFAREVSA